MTELSRRFGKAVADVRRRRGLSQERLAELTGLHRDTIRRIENDKASKDGPTLDTVERLAKGFELYPSELVGIADGSEQHEDERDDE